MAPHYIIRARMEHNRTPEYLEFDTDFNRMAIVIMALTMALALMGNSFLLVIIWKSARPKGFTSVQLLILHNCVADILFALVTILPTCAQFLFAPKFYGSDATCRLIAYMRLVPMYASPFILVAISRDRFKAICKPWRTLQHGPGERAKRYAGMSWFFALVCAIPNLSIYGLYENRVIRVLQCTAKFEAAWLAHVYVLLFCSTVWLLPSLLSGYFYFRVCYCVWHELNGVKTSISCKEMRRSSAERVGISEGNRMERQRLSNTCLQQIREVDRQKIHTIKLTLTIVSFSFVLWAPFCVTNLLHVFNPRLVEPTVATCIMLLGNLNSCVNPWIYVYFQWRQIKTALVTQHASNNRSRAYSYSFLSKYRLSETERITSLKRPSIDSVIARGRRQFSVDQQSLRKVVVRRTLLADTRGRWGSMPENVKPETVHEETEPQLSPRKESHEC